MPVVGIVVASSTDDMSAKTQKENPTTARQLVVSAFRDVPIMVRIAEAESHFNTYAKNPHSSAKGLFQILSGTWSAYHCMGSPYVAQDNINCARKIYEKEGTAPWAASKENW